MARSPSPDSKGYTNTEVRFERSDIEAKGILAFGMALGLGTLVVAIVMTWYGNLLVRSEQPRKKTNLPEARVDADRLPPEPRLEGLEDVRLNNIKLFPPRAAEFLRPQEHELAKGDKGKGVLSIQEAIDDLAGKLPVRKSKQPGAGGK